MTGARATQPIVDAQAGALRNQVLRLLLAAVVAPALLLGVVQLAYEYHQVQRQQQDRLRLAVRLTANSTDQYLQSHVAAVALAAHAASRNGTPPDLAGLRRLFPGFVTAIATDRAGTIVAIDPASRSVGPALPSVADREYFREPARTGEPFVSNAFRGRGLGTDALVGVSAPLFEGGAFDGVVEGSIRVDTFTALRSDAMRRRGQLMLLVDRDQRVVHASAGLPFGFRESVAGAWFTRGVEAADGVSAGRVDHDTLDGSAWAAWAELRTGWRVVLFEPRAPALAAVWRHAVQRFAVMALASLLVLWVARRQIDRIARATGATLETLRAVAAGEREPGAPIGTVAAELRPIAQQVVRMADELQGANLELRESLAAQRSLAATLEQANQTLEQTVRARTTELESANRHLERLSQTDALTSALNRRGLHACMAALGDAHGLLARPAAVLMFDVDRFKRFNDRYGHPAGDQVLRRVAACARASLRREGDCLARVGGEEFLVLMPGADIATALNIAERMRAKVRELGIPHETGIEGVVTISLGLAAGATGDAVEDIVQAADAALYRAKAAGRDRVAQ